MDDTKVPAPGSLHQRTGKRLRHDNSSTGFPICKLYNCAIVDHNVGPWTCAVLSTAPPVISTALSLSLTAVFSTALSGGVWPSNRTRRGPIRASIPRD